MSERWRGGFVVVGLLLGLVLAACGGSSSSGDGDDDPFDFDRFDYNGIVLLPFDAYREGRATTPDDPFLPKSVLFAKLFYDAANDTDVPFFGDWDTMLGLEEDGRGSFRDAMRFYVTYQVTSDPTSGRCVVTLDVFEGLPYDPDRPSLDFYQGAAEIGEVDAEGQPITDENECVQEATRRAYALLLAAGHFDEGWSRGEPAHTTE